jgi:predicted ATPase/class 3 adenylate cyclase
VSAFPTSGPLTFLFTDIEGSTRKAAELGDDWFPILEKHHEVLRPVFSAHGGVEVSTAGDSFFVVFDDARRAVEATVAMQHAIAAADWTPLPEVRVRMGLHTGLARFRAHDNDYAGLTVHAASRVESAAAGGQVLLSQATLDAAGELPAGVSVIDLGPHRLKDLPSEVQIYQVVADGLLREFPPVRGLEVAKNNVPVPASSFVGRTDVLARLHPLLDTDRLLTVIGSGGTGKTRVALQLATERLHRHADGVWFVALDGALDETGVAAAVAGALGVREAKDQTLLDAVIEVVSGLDVLLVFDNCEHVIDAAARVIELLLQSGPKVRVLATSREPLEISGERLWPLAPLGIDDDNPGGSEAVLLLADRVQRVQPDFVLSDALDDCVAIARRLDGLPLALELAAASAAMLPLADIAQQLDDRFALLTRGSRTALDRQKTLWGAIDWSYDLLDDEQKVVFRRLGVFPSEFDFGVATAVCGDGIGALDDDLSALMRKSLVTEAPSTRLRLLESIREYARQQLHEHDEFDRIAERHARWFVDGLADIETGLTEWVDIINEDLLAALHWGADHDRDLELRALVELQPFWWRKGRFSEGRSLSEKVLAETADLVTKTRWNALGNAGQLALGQGHTAAARDYFERAAAVATEVEGPGAAQVVLGDLGEIAAREGDLEGAEALYTRALTAAQELEDRHAAVLCLSHLSQIASQRGDLTRAWNLGVEALDGARELKWGELEFALTALTGAYALQREDYAQARQDFDDALATARKLG